MCLSRNAHKQSYKKSTQGKTNIHLIETCFTIYCSITLKHKLNYSSIFRRENVNYFDNVNVHKDLILSRLVFNMLIIHQNMSKMF